MKKTTAAIRAIKTRKPQPIAFAVESVMCPTDENTNKTIAMIKYTPLISSQPFTISVKSDQSSTLKARMSRTLSLNHLIEASLFIAL